jgi:hypothetical protein
MIHYRYKIPGLILILAGIGLTILYSVHRLAIQMPVFAIHSSYLVTKYFTVIRTNIFEEIIFLSYFAGFLLTAFSKEKTEREAYDNLRVKAWKGAILINTSLLIFCTLFVFGRGFIAVLILNLYSAFIFYHILFYLEKWRYDRRQVQ